MMPEETAVQIVVNHVSADEWPDWIEIPGSTKRAGFKVRQNADEPRESVRRQDAMIELARQATKKYLGSGWPEGKPLPTLSDTEVLND